MTRKKQAPQRPQREAQHTPTPWQAGRGGDNHWRIYRGKTVICQFGEGQDEFSVIPKNAAMNAAFIERAVNAHDELVEALMFSEGLIIDAIHPKIGLDHETARRVLKMIRAALAKAQGGKV